MASSYNLRSAPGQDQDTISYAQLPGTSLSGNVPHNHSSIKSNATAGRGIPGCHPARWIYELENNKFTTCDLFERAKYADLTTKFDWNHTHKLVINGKQSYQTPDNRLLDSVCLHCHYHFTFKMSSDPLHEDSLCRSTQAAWPMKDHLFPWHHLLWAGSDSQSKILEERSKYYPLLAREFFVCTASPCTFQLVLEITEPRMHPWWIDLLRDRDAILQALAHAKETEPDRYEGASPLWADQGLNNLNTYLRNLEESSPEDQRKISKRNKRFAVLFGPRCFEIFRELEFQEEILENEDGLDEGAFVPTPPPFPTGPNGSTEMGTYRAYIEDVRSEVNCLIHQSGPNIDEKPSFIHELLHTELGCKPVPGVEENAFVDIDRYKLLGILPNQPREIVVNAYMRQWELLPSRRRELVDALMSVANDMSDEPLMEYSMMQSSVFDSQLPRQGEADDEGLVNQALLYLGLSPPNTYPSDSVIDSFRRKIMENPSDASTARNMLMLVAQSSSDDHYQLQLVMEADPKMSLATSRIVLDVPEGAAWQQAKVAVEKKLAASKTSDEKALYLNALDSIADNTNSLELKQASIELRHQFKIFPDGNDASNDDGPADMNLPVGLNNIGNTCYLNSLLQYLFTVQVVRDVVLNYDDYKLEIDDEAIKERRLGGNKMQMDRGEAVVAQAFVRELADLFKKLQTSDRRATRPSQRLANAVLYSTHTIIEKSKVEAKSLETANPPLSGRLEEASQVAASDVEMQNAPGTNRNIETSSVGSSQTLVGADASGLQKEDLDMDASQQTTLQGSGSFADSATPITPSIQDTKNKTQDIDVSMRDTDTPSDIDEIVLKGLEHQDRSSGTEQQDVEEVIGSMINKLQAAIRPTSVDEKTGIQMEKVMETFFVTTINYTKKFDEVQYQTEISFDRSITAFPAPDGPCSLYEALGRNFDQQMLDDSKLSRYTAIKSLPPVLHVLIQRSQSIGRKNNNAVQIPETLFLDRFMDAPHDSEAFKRRVVEWSISSRLADVRSAKTICSGMENSYRFIEEYGDKDAQSDGPGSRLPSLVDDLSSKRSRPSDWDFDGTFDDSICLEPLAPGEAELGDYPSPPKKVRQVEEKSVQAMQQEADYLEKTLNDHFAGQQETPYRLQAVICHRGAMSSGHYWVWIHDFEQDVWRKYNDETVEILADTNTVLQTLCSTGEPYYLCYVRDSDKNQHVNVPKRDPPSVPVAPEEVSVPVWQESSSSGVERDDSATLSEESLGTGETELITFDDKGVEHVEHVDITPAQGTNKY